MKVQDLSKISGPYNVTVMPACFQISWEIHFRSKCSWNHPVPQTPAVCPKLCRFLS